MNILIRFLLFLWAVCVVYLVIFTGPFGVLLLFVCGMLSVFFWNMLATRKLSTLWLVTSAVRNELPLAEVLEGHALEFGGRRSRAILKIVKKLEEGSSLAEALPSRQRILPEEGRLALMVGTECGTLKESLDDSLDLVKSQFERKTQVQQYGAFYVASLLIWMGLIVSFIMVFIIPKYKEIFARFGVQMPDATMFVIESADSVAWVLSGWFFPLAIFVGLISLRLYWRYDPAGTLFGLLTYLFPKKYSVQVLRLLAVNAHAGKPLGTVVESLSRHFQDAVMRRRFNTVSTASRQGESLWTSLHTVRLIDDWQMVTLQAAEKTEQLSQTLWRISREIDQLQFHRQQVRAEFRRPVYIFCVGIFVVVFVVGMFMPLVKLINDLG